jgi:hypothetical protein
MPESSSLAFPINGLRGFGIEFAEAVRQMPRHAPYAAVRSDHRVISLIDGPLESIAGHA